MSAPYFDWDVYIPGGGMIPEIAEDRLHLVPVFVGPRGPKGEPGDGANSFPAVAATALGGQRAISINTAGQAVYFSAAFPDVVGISQLAVSAGLPVSIQFQGVMQEPSWTWIPGRPVYASANGVLTQTAPTTGFAAIVGLALAFDRIGIECDPPTQLV